MEKEEYEFMDDWMRNWYANRVDKIGGMDALRNLIGTVPVYEGRSFNNVHGNSNIVRKAFNYMSNVLPNMNDKCVDGIYFPASNSIRILNDEYPSTYVHESTHAVDRFGGVSDQIPNPEYTWEAGNAQEKNEFHEYLDNPLEIYARINQLRFNRNLNPLLSVTLAEIADMRQSGILNRYYLDRYSDSYLYNILNNYAQNNTQSESASVNVARNGGQLKYYRKK